MHLISCYKAIMDYLGNFKERQWNQPSFKAKTAHSWKQLTQLTNENSLMKRIMTLNFTSVLNKIQTQIALADIILKIKDVDSKISSESFIVLVWEIFRNTIFLFKTYPYFRGFSHGILDNKWKVSNWFLKFFKKL